MWGSEPSNSEKTSLALLFSSLWVAHLAGMGLDFTVIVTILLSHCGFSFVFGHGVSFFGRFQHLLLMIVQQLLVILMLLQEKMSACPSTLPS